MKTTLLFKQVMEALPEGSQEYILNRMLDRDHCWKCAAETTLDGHCTAGCRPSALVTRNERGLNLVLQWEWQRLVMPLSMALEVYEYHQWEGINGPLLYGRAPLQAYLQDKARGQQTVTVEGPDPWSGHFYVSVTTQRRVVALDAAGSLRYCNDRAREVRAALATGTPLESLMHGETECEDIDCPLHGRNAMPWRWHNDAFDKCQGCDVEVLHEEACGVGNDYLCPDCYGHRILGFGEPSDYQWWSEPRNTSNEVGMMIWVMTEDADGAHALWEAPTDDQVLIVMAGAWRLTEDDELNWGIETFHRPTKEVSDGA